MTRDAEGQLRKLPIPLHYLYVFIAGAIIGMFTITGMAGSYTRMLWKAQAFNQVRAEREALRTRYTQLEQVAQEHEIQAASLGSLASEISTLYGLKSDPMLSPQGQFGDEAFISSVDQFSALRTSAMSGAATVGIEFGDRNATTADWLRLASAPNLWPVEGPITGSFGERNDPFNGEGAFHTGVDISSTYGHVVLAPADGMVGFADLQSGYGRLVVINHANGISTRYGHLSAFNVAPGQHVLRGDVIGYVGLSGRSTGPHLHYEVRIFNTPVNPYKYLRLNMAQAKLHTFGSGAGR
ncbi:MAG: M23 family metallopeptidase [Acidobacteriota bacterium]|nr:M23 family metallopeptidase [Acidobacteriota bacterium]